MAEGPSRPPRYFCHRCLSEVRPQLPDLTCPHCESGFIEELPGGRSTGNERPSTSSTSVLNHPAFQNMDQYFFRLPSGFGICSLGIFDQSFFLRTRQPTENNRETESRRERELTSRQRCGTRQPRDRQGPRRQGTQHEGVPTLEGIIQQLLNRFTAPAAMPIGMGPWGMLHSSLMDYAWDASGLDAILTQLLNQFENPGPPPANGERIKNLPTITITEEHVGSGLECPVCKEDYSLGENVRQLPCNHLFHNDCIVPWLEQHDSCPVCRKNLSGQNTATDPPELSGINFSSSSSSSSSSNSPNNENASGNS